MFLYVCMFSPSTKGETKMPTNKPLEKSIENVLRKAVEAEGGLCLKWVCPGHRGVPDRMILFPGGIIAFVELKRPGAKVKAGGLQEWWREKIQSFGFPCYEISRKYQAVALVKRLSMGSQMQQMQQLSAEDAIYSRPDASVDWADDEDWPYESDD
nr:MAG TPA: Nuclease [Caudoviricetes sp.]